MSKTDERVDRETEFAIAAKGTEPLRFLHELAIGEALPRRVERATFEDATRLTDKVTRVTAQNYTAAALVSAHRVIEVAPAMIEDPDESRRILRCREVRSIVDSVIRSTFFMARIDGQSKAQVKATREAMVHLDLEAPMPPKRRCQMQDQDGRSLHPWA